MPALHGCRAACAVRGVPSVIAATKLTNAQVKAKELIIVLVNFVFMAIVSLSVWVFVVFLSLISFHIGTAGNPARYNVEILDFLSEPQITRNGQLSWEKITIL